MIIKYSDLFIRNAYTAEIVNRAWHRAPSQCRECPLLSVDIEDNFDEGTWASTVCGETGEFCSSSIKDCPCPKKD
jgi:hypothetical protein